MNSDIQISVDFWINFQIIWVNPSLSVRDNLLYVCQGYQVLRVLKNFLFSTFSINDLFIFEKSIIYFKTDF